MSYPPGNVTPMPADKVFPPADRPEIELLIGDEWVDADLHAWQARDDEQWAVVSWVTDGLQYRDTVPAERVRKPALKPVHFAMLDFETENQHWKYAAAKETAVLERFQWSMVRYYSMLNWVILQPEALEYAPTTVRRLERLRDARREARSSGRAD